MSDDPELETFLRRFRPVPPPPFLGRRRGIVRGLAGLTAAAAAVGVLWLSAPGPPPRSDRAETAVLRPTVGTLNAALRAGRYDDVLDDLSHRLLPDPLRAGSALHIIGDPGRDR